MSSSPLRYTDAEILAARPARNEVPLHRPVAFFVEPEYSAAGRVEDVATIFLANRECSFRCLMCDLWRNTVDAPTPAGAVPEQIDYALARLAPARHLKLYNSGNFFDAKAVPRVDRPAIAERARSFQTVVVENHPKLCTEECVRFRELLDTELEVALGLETIHPDVLPALNKQMTVKDFERAARFLVGHGIAVRAFVLLKPPFLSEDEGLDWAVRSMQFAFSVGVGCCSVIPTRGGNGIMDELQRQGHFEPPRFESLEAALEAGLRLGRGRVFADLWDVDRLASCDRCASRRIERLRRINLEQRIVPRIECNCGSGR